MKQVRASMAVIAVLVVASACTGIQNAQPGEVTPGTLVDSPTPGEPTATLTPEQPTSTPAATSGPATNAPAMLPTDCDAGFVVFSAGAYQARDGIYLACADGSFIRQIMSAASVLPDSWSSRNISVSPDGQKLAICANAGVADGEVIYRGGIYLLDLSDYSLSEVYLGDYRFTEVDWSADGQYVGYIRYAPAVGSPGDVLEILHVGTLTTSQILDVESVDPEGHSFILEDFDWSPDGTKINYRVDLLPRLTPKWYVEDITCDPQTHTCTLSNQRTLNWPTNGSYRLSWLPDASANVAMYAVSEDSVFLEIRGLNGELIRRAELDDLSLTSGGYCGLKDAVLSPNGERVAFKARSAGSSSLSDIFILSLNDMSVLNLTSAITSENVLPKGALFCQAEWLP